ncbi:MFS transporter [Caballeronia mineralivorans PML1(12)]|uniref:MFS transporter n=1 Tax=Caballeronia mineralivorans PML1(12) TaxID=908627 RepID=A0A0J1D374_9BURK|nr:MFS transporter [Caballeronia mineralivorans]KLU27182.1 MFS transporter [Caballeronia mineralivorans PML1(12)]
MKFGWFSNLSLKQRKIYAACYGAVAFDAMDSTMFPLVIPSLIALLGITHPQAGALTSAGLVGAAIGGWGAGILADRIGRVRVVQLTLIWVCLFTFISAFVVSFHQLIAIRFLQGLGIGGEGAAAGVLISEAVASKLRGRVAASIQSAYAVGYAISVSLLPLVHLIVPGEWAWRVFFGIGCLPAIFVLYIRRSVDESDVFIYEQGKKKRTSGRPAFLEMFTGQYLASTLTGTCMSFGILGGAYVMITWLPTYLRMGLHLPVAYTSAFLGINILGSFTGPLLCGNVIDRLGRKRSIMLLLTCQAVNVAVYTFAPLAGFITLILGYFLGALQAAIASTLMPTFSELYPTRMRAAGAGFCTSVGRGFGSAIPALVGVLSVNLKLATAMGFCAIAAYAIGIISASTLREASGVDLHEEIGDESSAQNNDDPQKKTAYQSTQ